MFFFYQFLIWLGLYICAHKIAYFYLAWNYRKSLRWVGGVETKFNVSFGPIRPGLQFKIRTWTKPNNIAKPTLDCGCPSVLGLRASGSSTTGCSSTPPGPRRQSLGPQPPLLLGLHPPLRPLEAGPAPGLGKVACRPQSSWYTPEESTSRVIHICCTSRSLGSPPTSLSIYWAASWRHQGWTVFTPQCCFCIILGAGRLRLN